MFAKTTILSVVALLGLGACTNPKTPEGHEGYVYHRPLLLGKVAHKRDLRGPSSTGASWRLFVINIDMRAKSYREDFKLLTRDNLSVEFEVNTRISLRPGSVKNIVEKWGAKDWYVWNVKEPSRTTVRRMVTRVSATDIQLKTEVVRARIHERLLAKYKKSPIKIESVDIGNIRFPREVTQAIERKIGQQQELQRQEFVLDKTKKEAKIRVAEALKAAEQQRIIGATLDHLYIQRQAIQVYRLLAQSPNKTILVLPNSPTGTGIPLVLSDDTRKIISPADLQLLKDMRKQYGLDDIAKTDKLGATPASTTPTAPGTPPAGTPPTGAAPDQPGMQPAAPAMAPPKPAKPAKPAMKPAPRTR